MTTYTVVTSVVAIDQADTLREMAADLTAGGEVEGAVGLWSVEASDSGEAPATHAVCAGWIDDELIALLPTGVILDPTDPLLEDAP